MLQNIRDKAQGWVSWVIIIGISLTFALWGIHRYQGSSTDQTVVKVDGQAISQTVLNSTLQRARQQIRSQNAGKQLTQAQDSALKKEVLDGLVQSEVLSQAANKAGYRVTPQQIDATIWSIPAFQKDGKFSEAQFQNVLNRALYSPSLFVDNVRKVLLINQVKIGLINSAFTLPSEANQAVKLIEQKREIGYMVVPSKHFEDKVSVTQDAIEKYYQQHQQQFKVPEKVSIEYLELTIPEIAAKQHSTEKQMQSYYKSNMERYTIPAQWHVAHILLRTPNPTDTTQIKAAKEKANTIYKKLQQGANFATLAKKYSDDVVSARNGGLIEWFKAGEIGPEFQKAVDALKKPGQYTKPVQTQYGIDIIKLIAKKDKQVKPFKSVEQQIKKNMALNKAQEIFANQSDELANQTFSNPTSLTGVAKTLGLKVQSTDLFTRDGGNTTITKNPQVIKAAYSPTVLEDGNNSDMITLNDNAVIVLRIKQHIASSVEPLKKVESVIKKKLIADLAKKQAVKMGKELLAEMKRGKSGKSLASKNNFKWVTENVGRHTVGVDEAVLQQAFQMKRTNDNQPSVAGIQLSSGNYALVQVNKVTDGQLAKKQGKSDLKIFSKELAQSSGAVAYQLYINSQMKKAEIKYEKQS